jgi:rhodanese-related sulfurtransferase
MVVSNKIERGRFSMKSTWMRSLLFIALSPVLVGPLLLGPLPARADYKTDVPKGVTVIDAEQLKRWVDRNTKMLLVDARIAPEYKEGHIPTAINVPYPVMEQHRKEFPRDLNYLIVFYCNGWPNCKKSHDACVKAVQWGYKNVHWFRAGIPVWQSRGYPVE